MECTHWGNCSKGKQITVFSQTLTKCLPQYRRPCSHLHQPCNINSRIFLPPYGMLVFLNTYRRRWKPFKRALTTIYGLASYKEHLCASGLVPLKDRRVKICSDLFNEMCKPDHELNHLIPKPHERSKCREMPNQLIPLSLHML